MKNSLIQDIQSINNTLADAEKLKALKVATVMLFKPIIYRFLCNDAQKEGVKLNPDLVCGIFGDVSLYNVWHGIVLRLCVNGSSA